MRFRWTMKDLEQPDTFILRGLVAERLAGLNCYAPLARRLQQLHDKLTKKLERDEMRRRAKIRARTVRFVRPVRGGAS